MHTGAKNWLANSCAQLTEVCCAAAAFPLAGHYAKVGLLALEVPLVSAVPASVLAYAAEAGFLAVRSLV